MSRHAATSHDALQNHVRPDFRSPRNGKSRTPRPASWRYYATVLVLAGATLGASFYTYRSVGRGQGRLIKALNKLEVARITAALPGGNPSVDGMPLSAYVTDPVHVDAGQALFARYCGACHGAEAQGYEGPDLADAHWIYGGSNEEILRSITIGAPDRGMPAWGDLLPDRERAQLVAYIQSLRTDTAEAIE